MLTTEEIRLEWGRLEKDMDLSFEADTSFKRAASCRYHVFMQLCIKHNYGRVYNFRQSSRNWFQECISLVSIHLGKRFAAAILQGTNHWNNRKRSSNVGGVFAILEHCLNALGVDLKNCARTK
jgi:hypothetical protein